MSSPRPSTPASEHTPFPFLLSRDRDAWATIRGFVYQVDRTIAEWLDIGEGEVLEVERGEDIDRITTALRDAGAEQHRRLEQVKHREPTLTLQSDVAREALANFFQHRHDNPTLTLRFRFTTTAGIGRERRNRLPGRLPAIAAWEQVRRDVAIDVAGQELLRGLREFVLGLTRPERVSAGQWTRFHAFVQAADEDEWFAFIMAFEWVTQAPDSESLRGQVGARLMLEHGVGSKAEADLAYQRLFAVVFDRLCQAGIKRLDRPDLLEALRRVPTLIDPTLLTELTGLHEALAEKVDALEQQIHDVGRVLATTAAQVGVLAQRAGITALIDPRAVAAPATTPPPRATHSSPRTATVDGLTAPGQPRATVLYGGLMAGKTQLALLMADRLGARPVWIRLGGAPPGESGRRLAHALDTVLAHAGDGRREAHDWTVRCAGLVAAADVIVLDDVPSFKEGDELGSRLLPLLMICLTAGHQVVLTSSVPLVTLERLVPPKHLHVVPVPPLTAAEVREVMVSYAAPPDAIAPQFVDLLVGVTAGHPLLVHAAAQWLEWHGWQTDLAALDLILRRRYAEPVNRETAQALLDGVSDGPTRELLYRLVLTGGDFGPDELDAVAEVLPTIDARGERFAALLGPWVQPTAPDQYVISPLVHTLGKSNLATGVRRQCHLALGRLIVGRSTIGELGFGRALTHFISADDLDAAAMLLIQGLFAVYTHPPVKRTLITAVWSEMPIPEAVSRPYRALIRAFQAAIAPREGRDPGPFLTDLAVTLDSTPRLEAWAEFTAAVFVAIAFALTDAVRAAPFILRAVTLWPLARERLEVVRSTGERALPEPDSLVWICIGGVQDEPGLEAFMSMVTELPVELRTQLFSSPLGVEASMNLASKVLLWEYDAPVDARDWSRAAKRLERIEVASRSIGAIPLQAAAQAARVSAIVEGARDPSPGAALAEAALAELNIDSDGAFLTAKAVGYGALDMGHPESARTWFVRANALPGTGHAVERLRVKLRLAQLLGPMDPDAAIAFAEDAVALAPTAQQSFLPPDVEVRYGRGDRGDTLMPGALGELALARWFAGDRRAAYRTWLEALDALITRRADEDELWKSLFVAMGHVSGYLTGMATRGEAPSHTAEGEPYAPPRQGMLITPPKNAATYFRSDLVPTLGIQAMRIADAIGDPALAVAWASRAADGLRALGLWTAAAIPARRLLEEAVVHGDFAVAIEHATEVALAHWAVRGQPPETVALFEPSAAPGRILDARPDTDWTQIDGMVVTFAVLPAFVHVALEREREPARGESLARTLHEACVNAARSDAGSVVWAEVVALCEATLLRMPNADALRLEGERLRIQGDAFTSIGALAYLGASLDPNASLSLRAKLQLAVAQYVLGIILQSPPLHDDLEFFDFFWRRAFREGRLHFRAPALVERQLEEIEGVSPSRRMRRVLRAVAWGLRVPLSTAMQAWLAEPLPAEGATLEESS